MELAVDPKADRHRRRGWFFVFDRTGGKRGMRQCGQQQRCGSGLDHRAAGDLNFVELRIGFLLVHDCSVGSWPVKLLAGRHQAYGPVLSCCPSGRHPAYGQVSSGRLTTMGVAVLRTTTHRNGRSEEHTSELQSLTNLVCRLLLE